MSVTIGKKSRILLSCVVCGTRFEKLPCQLTRGRGRFCSRKCTFEGMKTRTVVQCALCDSPFLKHISEQERTDSDFCSRDCYMQWRTINRDRDTYPKNGATHRHRLVAANHLGRDLIPGEVVHHIDEDKQNFSPENLAVFPSQSHHARCHQGNMLPEELDRYRLVNLSKRSIKYLQAEERDRDMPTLFDLEEITT